MKSFRDERSFNRTSRTDLKNRPVNFKDGGPGFERKIKTEEGMYLRD